MIGFYKRDGVFSARHGLYLYLESTLIAGRGSNGEHSCFIFFRSLVQTQRCERPNCYRLASNRVSTGSFHIPSHHVTLHGSCRQCPDWNTVHGSPRNTHPHDFWIEVASNTAQLACSVISTGSRYISMWAPMFICRSHLQGPFSGRVAG
jgi:hypothetical protein